MKLKLGAVVFLLAMVGCVHKHTRPEIWRFTKCAKNNGTIVCVCEKYHKEVNAKNGGVVIVCD